MKKISFFLFCLVFNLSLTVWGQDTKTVTLEMTGDYAQHSAVQLAPKRFFMVEFPAGDEVLATSSSDDEMIRGDDSFVEKNDPTIPLLFRAQKNWGLNQESVTILIMMKSGAVLNLEVSPVDNIASSNDRVRWLYDPVKIVAVRSQKSLPLTVAEQKVQQLAVKLDADVVQADGSVLVSSQTVSDPVPLGPDEIPPMPVSTDSTAEKLAREMLLGLEPENFAAFPKDKPLADNPDLIVSALSSQWVKNGTWTVSIIGVQNKSQNSVQLIDFPRLRISTKGDKGQNLNDETIIPLGVATSSKDFPVILQSRQVVYFAYVFKTPVLGSTQSLQVLATHTNLADKPAILVVRPGGTN